MSGWDELGSAQRSDAAALETAVVPLTFSLAGAMCLPQLGVWGLGTI